MLVTALLHEEYLKEYSLIDGTVMEFSDWLLEDQQVLAKQYIMDSIKVCTVSNPSELSINENISFSKQIILLVSVHFLMSVLLFKIFAESFLT